MAERVSLISAEMTAALNKIIRRRTSYPISASDIRKWALAIYFPEQPPPQFLGAGAAGGEAPLLAPEEFNPFAWAAISDTQTFHDVSPSFIERQAGVKPPNLTGLVAGGSACEYGAPMFEDDVITSELHIKSYVEKPGKAGLLLLTDTHDVWTNQRGEHVRTNIFTHVRF